MKKRIVLLTHSQSGGVWSVTKFAEAILRASGRYDVDVALLATSSTDEFSLRFARPSSWRQGAQVFRVADGSQGIWRIGALGVELETQRYQPRPILTEFLSRYDLVFVIAGSPAWTWVTRFVERPVALFAATRALEERHSFLSRRPLQSLWSRIMSHAARRIEDRALGRPDVVFAESKYALQLFARHTRPERLVLAPPGVDCSAFSKTAALSDGQPPYILSVGRLSDPRKNVNLLIRAYREIRNRVPDAPRLRLVGKTGPSKQDRELISRLDLNDHVDVFLDVSKDDLIKHYATASLYVLSSDEEGLGVVLLEAMASSLPIVSTDCGGPATVIDDGRTGLLVPTGSVDALAGAVCRLLGDRALADQLGKAARTSAVEDFSVEAAGRVYLRELDRLMRSN